MLTCCQLDPQEHVAVKFISITFRWRKRIWKYRVQTVGHFCSSLNVLYLYRRKKEKLAYDDAITWTHFPLRWRHNERDSVSNHQPHHCLLNRLFRHRSKKTSKLRVTGLCVGNSPGTGEFPTQMASNSENVSIWWRHHASLLLITGRV